MANINYLLWFVKQIRAFIQSLLIKFHYKIVSKKPCKVFTSISPYLFKEER